MSAMPPREQTPGAIAQALADLAGVPTGERVRLRDLVDALGDRTFSLLILVLSLPNAVGLGTIPGVSTIFGLPQLFVAVQMAAGLARPWLPAWLLDRTIARDDLLRIIAAATPWILRIERVLRPRRFPLFRFAERTCGAVLALLALIQALPIPFGNQPPAVAAAVIAIGLIAADWVVVVVGLAATVLATAVAAGVVWGGAAAVTVLLRHIFG